jgi:hypothetical protein
MIEITRLLFALSEKKVAYYEERRKRKNVADYGAKFDR